MDFTKRNSSALIYATAARHARIVQMPIEAKTDVYRPRMLADSAEMLAGTVNDVEDPTAIDSTISMLLIQQGFNVQVTGERGSTLLHYMANCGYAALFAVLIELNLEVNRQNDDGRTPLYFATNQKKHHFMKLLLRIVRARYSTRLKGEIILNQRCRMPWSDLYSFPSLQLHVKTAYPDRPLSLLKTIVDAGALVPCQDNYGRTPFLLAVWGNQNVVMFLTQKRCAGLPFLVVIRRLLVGLPDEARQVVKRLLNAGMDLESVRDPNGRTPLMAAICSGSTQVFMMMFNKISVVDERDYEGRTALFIATQIGNLQIVHLLLRWASSIDYSNLQGVTPLIVAIQSQNTEAFYRLLIAYKKCDQIDRTGRIALYQAMDVHNIHAIERLLHKSRALNLPDKQGCTPLLLAVQHGWVSIVALTLQRSDINVNTKHSESCSPLTWAVTNHTSTVTSLLLEHGAKIEEHLDILYPRYPPLLIQTSTSGHLDLVCRYFQYSATTKVQNPSRHTPLIHAACSGYTGIVDIFLRHNGNFQACDNNLRSVLFYAPLCGHEFVVNMLLERGANIKNTDIEGRTPLAGAARNGHAEVVLRLLEKGACPDLKIVAVKLLCCLLL
ncbi:unnamed protein product [Aspergillus oryzae]|uniref:Unnamed protein product n=1 Tax=Aspergillus oryzae TaxID=5062 RepID=A0AAN4Y7R9_ASPOZ|nr:unnamed protein product [Aspergillus oryzae]